MIYKTEEKLRYHFDSVHGEERMCDVCHTAIRNLKEYQKHKKVCKKDNGKKPSSYLCLYCRESFASAHDRDVHYQRCAEHQKQASQFGGAGPSNQEEGAEEEEEELQWDTTYALKKNVSKHSTTVQNQYDLEACLINNKKNIISKLKKHLQEAIQGIKWQISGKVAASREVPAEPGSAQLEIERQTLYLNSYQHTLFKHGDNVQETVEKALAEVLTMADHTNLKGSSWVISEVVGFDLNIATNSPLRGSSYIATPTHLKNSKQTLVNIQNYGNDDCFRLSIIAALHPAADNKCRQSNYTKYLDELNMGNIKYEPMKVKDIPRFEKLNPTISLTVLYEDVIEEDEEEKEESADGDIPIDDSAMECEEAEDSTGEEEQVNEEEEEEGEAVSWDADTQKTKKKTKSIIVPLYCTSEKKENHITLLLLEREGQYHYVLVQDIHAFLYSQTRKRARAFYCCYCLNTLPTQERLNQHENSCKEFGAQRIEYAKPGTVSSFDAKCFPKTQRVPFTAYFDFECALKKLEGSDESGRNRVQEHVPVAYAIAVVDWEGKLARPVISHAADKDVDKHFVDTVLQLEEELWAMRPDFPLHMSPQQEKDCKNAKECYLCRKPFEKDEDRVRDHEHLQEKENIRGMAHGACNSAVKRTSFLSLVSHNGSKYDVHLVFRAFMSHPKLRSKRISVLAKTMDTYRSVTIHLGKDRRSIKMVDSFNFFSEKLDSITEHLTDAELSILKEAYPDPTHYELLRRKGVYCYEFTESYAKLVAQKTLPARQDFYSSLSNSLPSAEEYERAQHVWNGMGCESLLDYMRHYLYADVLLLAAFFTKFKAMTFAKYGLEVCHFVSISSLTWCQALKFTHAEVEVLSDPDMYQMFERQKRGGLACIMQRYSEANVPGTSTYSPSKPEKHIQIYDVNALYSNEMCKKLAYNNYQWVEPEDLAKKDWTQVREDDDEMYTVEVSLEYPAELHDAHDEWPCAVEKVVAPIEWMSPYQQRIAARLPKAQLKEPKLIAHLGPRQNYVVHGAVLALYLKLGLRVTKFHRGVKYEQKAWLKPYIEDLMTERQRTKLKFEQKAYKQFSNSTYGYLLRNPRFDRQVEIVCTPERMKKLVAKPTFKSFTIFDENLVAVEKAPSTIKLMQCVAAGVSVLDTSKKTMMELYWVLKGQFGKRMKTLFTDTDSLGVEIESPDIVGEMRNLNHVLDTSGLLPNHPLYSTQFARVQGRLKIEYGEMNILRFAAVRAKCYAIEMESQDKNIQNIYKCKGVKSVALKQSISFEDYKRCIFDNVAKQVKFHSLQSDGAHRVFTLHQQKYALRNFDSKRWILEDGYRTRAFCNIALAKEE